jgi:hypothetical protein
MAQGQLKPCPCGKKPTMSRGGPGNVVWYITCERDYHNVSIQCLESRDEAVAKWNTLVTRPEPPTVAQMREALEKIGQQLCGCHSNVPGEEDWHTPTCKVAIARAALQAAGCARKGNDECGSR